MSNLTRGARAARKPARYLLLQSSRLGAASPGRNTNPGHNITRFNGLQSLCEVMSNVPAGATECRRCFRDFRKEDRQWDVVLTSDSNSTASQKGEI